jgi:hypothetical protein
VILTSTPELIEVDAGRWLDPALCSQQDLEASK